jgi:hypothetical protein
MGATVRRAARAVTKADWDQHPSRVSESRQKCALDQAAVEER